MRKGTAPPTHKVSSCRCFVCLVRRILQQAAERAALERRWAPVSGALGGSDAAAGEPAGRLQTVALASKPRESTHVGLHILDDDEDDDLDVELRRWLRARSLLHLADYVALVATEEISVRVRFGVELFHLAAAICGRAGHRCPKRSAFVSLCAAMHRAKHNTRKLPSTCRGKECQRVTKQGCGRPSLQKQRESASATTTTTDCR